MPRLVPESPMSTLRLHARKECEPPHRWHSGVLLIVATSDLLGFRQRARLSISKNARPIYNRPRRKSTWTRNSRKEPRL